MGEYQKMENENQEQIELTTTELEELEIFDDTSDIEEALHETNWQEEAEQIPLEALPPEDQLILLKFKQHQKLSTEEDDRLALILQQYRPAIQKIQPQKIIDNYEQNTVLVEDEKLYEKMSKRSTEIFYETFTADNVTRQIEEIYLAVGGAK